MIKTQGQSPKYKKPPVIETVLGVQFNPLKGFSVPHFGLYWETIRDNYGRYQVQPPLRPVVEQFESETWKEPQVGLQLISAPDIRCWFINELGNKLIQVQKDRFIHNWRKVRDDESYPEYANIKPAFMEGWMQFCSFLEEAKVGKPDVNQCEVTYVNHIPLEKGWSSFGDLEKLVSCWSGTSSGGFLPKSESASLNLRYVMPEKKGRLRIILQPVMRSSDGMEVVQLRLIARGKPASSSVEDISDWLDIGHDWVVRGFTDFTTDQMHQFWERTL